VAAPAERQNVGGSSRDSDDSPQVAPTPAVRTQATPVPTATRRAGGDGNGTDKARSTPAPVRNPTTEPRGGGDEKGSDSKGGD
jgi:hypothetical protein